MFLRNKGEATVVVIAILAVVAAIGFASAKILKKDDGPVEEASEQIIEEVSGYDVDLTPGSPEQKISK